jgi:spermidine synthase
LVPRELIATAQAPGGEELRLFRRGRDFMIVVDRNELMSTRMSGSEEALARLAIAALGQVRDPQLLIGGYGMGFTLRAALAELPAGARVTVAELVPEIVEWARGPMAELTAGALADRRVTIDFADVALVIGRKPAAFDAILLDVDNGPDGLTKVDNDGLYTADGLAAARAALRPRGVLAIWSAAPDAAFARRLKGAGFEVEEHGVRARSNGKGPRHVIWLAKTRG